MPESFTFAAECHVDTTLARALVRGNVKLVEHIRGVPNVGKRLADLAIADQRSRVVGLVDWDRGTVFNIPGLQPFANQPLVTFTFAAHGFQIYQHLNCPNHFLVVLNPACDGWLFEQAAVAAIDLSDHHLPVNWLAFLAFTKSKLVEDHPRLISLLKALRRQPSPGFELLVNFIEEQVLASGRSVW